MASRTAVKIDIAVFQNRVTGEFFEDDDVEVTRDGYDVNWEYNGNKVMHTCSLVEALNNLRQENINLRARLEKLEQRDE